MKKIILLFLFLYCTFQVSFSTIFDSKSVRAYMDYKNGKIERSVESFLEICGKDSLSPLGNYSLSLIYSNPNYTQYNLELSYKYIQKACKNINLINWNTTPKESELKDVVKLKIEPVDITHLKYRIIDSIYEHTKKQNTIAAFKHFIQSYPEESDYVKSAKLFKQSLAFRSVLEENTISGYNQFLIEYPDYFDKQFIFDLIDNLQFKDVVTKNTIVAYNNYILKYPYSSKIKEAQERVDELVFNDVKQKNTIEAYDNYISIFPNSTNINEAIKKRAELAFNKAKEINTEEAYKKFIENYPDAIELQEAKDLMNSSLKIESKDYCTILLPKYDIINDIHEGLAAISYNNKWGYVNEVGEIIIPLKYDTVGDFSKGLAPVKRNEKWGYINKLGYEIISVKLKYDLVKGFRECGVAEVKIKEKVGLIDKTGKNITPIKYFYIGSFYEGVAPVYVLGTNLFGLSGLIDSLGNEIIPPQDLDIKEFHCGRALVTKEDESSGYIDKTGSFIIPMSSSRHGYEFSEGLACVSNNSGKYGYIDTNGKQIIPFQYDYPCGRFIDGFACIKLYDGTRRSKYIDVNNNVVFIDEAPIRDEVFFEENIAGICVKGKKMFITNKGVALTKPIYDYGMYTYFSDGMAGVSLNDKWGFIDRTGREVIKCQYDLVGQFNDGIAMVYLNKKYGFIDKIGREVTKLEYDNTLEFSNGLAPVKRNGKWGVIDKTGMIVSPCQFDMVGFFNNSVFKVMCNDKWGLIGKCPLK